MASYNFDMQLDEQESEDDIFGTFISCSLDSNESSCPELFCVGTLHHKLFLSSTEISHGYDTVQEFIQRTDDFQRNLRIKNNTVSKRQISGTFHNLSSQIAKIKKDCSLKVPSYVPNFMKFVRRDPDEAFCGQYNWYLTGGSLQHLYTDQTHKLLFVEGTHRDKLCVAPLKNDPMWCVDKSCVQKVIPCSGKEIFQVIGIDSPSHTFIGTRQKHRCHIYTAQMSDMNLSITECIDIESDVSFASFGISPIHKELCTINTKQGMTFWDICKKEEPMTIYYPSDNPKYDKWHSLWYSADPSVVSVAGRKSCKWMDRRTSGPNNSIKLNTLRGVRDDEEISVHFASEQNPYFVYIGTNVNLFMIDTRSLSSGVHRWSHQLNLPPLYSSVISLPGKNEVACIGNQYPGNVILAFSSINEALPVLEMPSRLDSLLSYQAAGACLDPSIKARMTCSLAGLTNLKDPGSSNVELLTQTAACDIFSQALFDNSIGPNSCNLNSLVTSKETLHASERWNMSKLYSRLSDETSENRYQNYRKRCRQKWQISKHELAEYKDVLSPIILEEWDTVIEGEELGVSSSQKVSAWLNSYTFKSLGT